MGEEQTEKDVVALETVRREAVAAYKRGLVTALRNSGAIVRRLLADEIEAGKWDAPDARPRV